MKIAVCYSGLLRDNFDRNLASVKRHWSKADYYFSTWRDRPLPTIKNLMLFNEPTPHYHPFLDVVIDSHRPKWHAYKANGKKEGGHAGYSRTLHQCKQILGHCYLLDAIDSKKYDVIIRLRYDTYLSSQVDFSGLLKRSVDGNLAVGFGTRTERHKNLHELYEIPKVMCTEPPPNPEKDGSYEWDQRLLDVMIFHPPKLLNTKYVYNMYNEKKLWSSESGWWQALSEPTGGTNHLCVYGGAQTNAFLHKHKEWDK